MKNKSITIARISLLTVAVAFITIGLLKQEHLEVIHKAVKICLECIGIG